MIARIQNLLQRFKRDEKGVAAVEFALASPIFVGLLLASLDLSSTSFANNNMTSSLRFSAQYIANGGDNIDVAENVFERSFGEYDSFSASVSCTCAHARQKFDPDAGQSFDPVSEILGGVTGDISNAPICTTDCGEDPVVRYLKLSASARYNPIIGTQKKSISKVVSVRLKQ